MRIVKRHDFEVEESGRVLSIGRPPPVIAPVRSDRLPAGETLAGRRVLIVEPGRWLFDMRAIDEPRDGAVWVLDESDWYAFRDSPEGFPPSRVQVFRSGQVWTDFNA